MKTLLWHNKYHLGDCVYHLHYMQHLQDANLQERFKQIFFCNKAYHDELQQLNVLYPDITFEDYSPTGDDCWVGHEYFKLKAVGLENQYSYNDVFCQWWNQLSDSIKLDSPFANKYGVLNDNIYLARDHFLNDSGRTKCLVIDCEPKSGQWDYNDKTFELFSQLNCGIDLIWVGNRRKRPTYWLYEIGRMAQQVDYIVGVDTGPMSVALNKWSVRNCKGIYVCHKYNTFDYGHNVHMIRNNEELANLRLE